MARSRPSSASAQSTATIGFESRACGVWLTADKLRNRNTVEFRGIWESVFNPDFDYGEPP